MRVKDLRIGDLLLNPSGNKKWRVTNVTKENGVNLMEVSSGNQMTLMSETLPPGLVKLADQENQ